MWRILSTKKKCDPLPLWVFSPDFTYHTLTLGEFVMTIRWGDLAGGNYNSGRNLENLHHFYFLWLMPSSLLFPSKLRCKSFQILWRKRLLFIFITCVVNSYLILSPFVLFVTQVQWRLLHLVFTPPSAPLNPTQPNPCNPEFSQKGRPQPNLTIRNLRVVTFIHCFSLQVTPDFTEDEKQQ